MENVETTRRASGAATLPIAHLILLCGASAGIMIKGTQDVWAIVLFLSVAGFALFFLRPVARPGVAPLVLVPLFCSLCLLAFLPQDYFPLPQWRQALAALGTIPLGQSVNPQPWLGWFWWWLLAGTCCVGLSLLASPLSTRALAIVLHSAAFFVAVYASLAMFAAQTGWQYPFHGGAVFGFLPNRNHTATLLVVGSVLSFGLMQWRLSRGNSSAATFAALCGAPALAGLLFFSVSRAGVLLLVVGLLLWGVGAARSSVLRPRLLVAASILVVFLCLLFVAGGSVVRDRMADLTRGLLSVDPARGASQHVDFRQPIFRDTLRMVADAPLTGTGLGQFADVFPQYRRASIREAVVFHPESDWLLVATETGLPSAAVLAALLAWYVWVCWRSYHDSGGMLRWTAASAVTAAALHGAIDVPWHGFSLGWFLLIVAASSVPSSGYPAQTPALGRSIITAGGLLLLAAATWIGVEKWRGRSPTYYRWPELAAELQLLGEQQRFDQAEKAAARAVQQFPLNYETYYWMAGHLRAFEGTDPEIHAAIKAGRAVEPVMARVAAEQAVILQPIDPDAALAAWNEAIARSALIDQTEGKEGFPAAGEIIRRALVANQSDPERQVKLAGPMNAAPLLLSHWVIHANPEALDTLLPQVAEASQLLEGLPLNLRSQLLSRWISSSDSARAVEFMEQQEAVSSGGEYWPVLARHYAAKGDLPRAVRRVASSKAISLDAPRPGDSGLRGQMADVSSQGNPVAARRMAKEAVDAQEADQDNLAAAMAYFASQNDWEFAWKAASRLATEAKGLH